MKPEAEIIEEAGWVRAIRNSAGIVAIIGTGILGVYALTRLSPQWESSIIGTKPSTLRGPNVPRTDGT